ncbi:MAG TPA: MFS transporter [Roseiarcus sp.]|nr:MFS transporter [Roseiarcus sp.]
MASRYRWVIVGAGGLLGCVAIGAMFALPVFLTPMAAETGWGRTGISSAMTIGFLTMALGSVGWGAFSDRYGPRPAALIGVALLAAGLALAAQARELWQFQLAFGGLVGLAAAAVLAPMMAAVTGWFTTQRSLAVSLVSAGMGMAPMTMAPLAAALIARYDWRQAYLILAGLVLALMLPAALLVRRAPAQKPADEAAPSQMTVAQALRSSPFLVLVLTNFACCATHSGPIFHTVSYAISCGVPALAAVSIYSVEGLAGLFGRIGFGLAGDRFGAKRVLVAGLFVQAFGALAYGFVSELDGFYAVAMLFGFTYAGVMPLYAVLARENFPMRMMGLVIGASGMAGSLGMALGPLLGGWIYDAYATYFWLYLISFALGIGAALIAATFRPFAEPARALAPAE